MAILLVNTYFIPLTITAATQYFVLGLPSTRNDGANRQKKTRCLLLILKFFVWAMGIIFLPDNPGYHISTIIAGLGIGGIAIALAAQTILADLFSYFVIIFDRSFEIDDFVVVDDKSGEWNTLG